ncbi:MAG: LysR family transcriptional regulator [Gammaproteobacteria bacterium]|nr:LysR family transcriptional regulator [Gammaproteobacteria bacterium]
MHLHQLKYFVSIVDTGSMTKAAERCFISQPSISQQLSKLEDNVGKKLFSREHGKLVLTSPGQIMYEQAREILSKVEEAKRRVSDADETSGGSVSIGILPTLAPFILPSTLLSLSQQFPNAMVTVREEISEAIVDAAARGEIDILIEVLPFDETHLNIEPLFSDDFLVAVHQDSPLAKLDEIPIDALDDMPFILLEDIHCLARQIQNYCFSKQFVPKVLFQASQLATVKHLIELQYGISILPRISIEDDPDSSIRYIKLQGERPIREVVLATAKDRYLSPAAEYFVSIVKEQYQTTT